MEYPIVKLKGEIYQIFNLEESHEYDLYIQEEASTGHIFYVLRASHNSSWSEEIRGEILLTLIDTGDEIKIVYPYVKEDDHDEYDGKVAGKNIIFEIDYAEEEYLYVIFAVKRQLYKKSTPSLVREITLKVLKSELQAIL